MTNRNVCATFSVFVFMIIAAAIPAASQSFRVQCPSSTITHPITAANCSTNPTAMGCNNTEPAYTGPTQFNAAALGLPGRYNRRFLYAKE